MRSRWKAVVAAPLFALSTSCSDGTGVVGPLENLVLAFCASDLPVWFAFQNDGGAWTRVQPDANNSFAFEATPKVAIAMVLDFGSSRLTDIYYTTFEELEPLSNVACTETSGTKTVNGSVSGLLANETARISMSGSTANAFAAQTAFTLTNVANAPQDVIAQRTATGISDATPNRVIVRRAQNPLSNATLSVFDFSATEALAIATNTLTITGLQGGEQNYYSLDFRTATGTEHFIYESPFFSSASQTLYGIPTSLTQAGDVHILDLNADASSGTSYRTVRHWYRNPADKPLSFGASLNTPTVTNVASTPTARLRTTLAAQSDYGSFATAYFIQSSTGRSVFVTVTSQYLGGVVNTWTNEVPDLTPAGGYPANAGLQANTQTQWFVEAFSGSLAAWIGGTPIDGAVVKYAGRSSNTSTVQMSVERGRRSPRAELDRRGFRR